MSTPPPNSAPTSPNCKPVPTLITPKICPHGLQKNGYFCKKCWQAGVKGKGICQHGTNRFTCTDPECAKLRNEKINPLRVPSKKHPKCPHGKSNRGQFCFQCYDAKNPLFKAYGICKHRKYKHICPDCHQKPKCKHNIANEGYGCIKCFHEGVRNRGVCRHGKRHRDCIHVTCNHHVLHKLRAISYQVVQDFLQLQLDNWNLKQLDPNSMKTLSECEIEYVRPLITFSPDEQYMCFEYTNLQPVPPPISDSFTTWTPSDNEYWFEHIHRNFDRRSIYIPGSKPAAV